MHVSKRLVDLSRRMFCNDNKIDAQITELKGARALPPEK